MLDTQNVLLNNHSRFSPALAERLSILILLTVALMTTSCGAVAQAAGGPTIGNSLTVSGDLPAATLDNPYNATVSVVGGRSPYHFSVRTGTLPPGVILDASTGLLAGMPTSTGTFSFEVGVSDSPLLDQGSQAFSVVVGKPVTVNLSPTSATVLSAGKQQFSAGVSGTSNSGIAWSASAGSISGIGLYTAPTVTSETNVIVTATSNADPSLSASATVAIEPQNTQAPQIATGALSRGQQGEAYTESFTATGGTTPYSWSISGGTPPPGVTVGANGDFAGTPTAVGTFNFAVTVTDADNKTASGSFSVSVAAGSGYDGPAQLPIVTVSSSMADTPAPGAVINVNAGGNLQAALNNAQCGNTIELQAGATFTGVFEFPAKNCDSDHWIIVRTSAPDSALPNEGQRLTPCYAGVASLPGRPTYPCNNPQNVLAKLILSGGGDGPVMFQSGANHYRLIGLELTRPSGTKGGPALMTVQQKGTASYLVLDRSWLHGTAQDDTRDGFELAGTTYVAVVDSYFTDFHCTSDTGSCTDSHAVSGGLGITQDGPYEIRDNFLEASGEAIIFGGGSATTTPTDITIHYNHFFKPWQWMKGNTPFQGGASGNPFIVKNHLELKNAVRVLAEANLMENAWGGFSQTGFAILLTPKNQHNNRTGQDVCPICEVTDVTIRYTRISHTGGGIVMATVISGNGTGGAAAKAGTRFSIHDVVMDDISRKYVGLGRLFLVANTWLKNPVNTVTINHITGFPDADNGGVLIMGNSMANPAITGFVFTNSLITTGRYPVWNVGGGDTSCAVSDVPVTSINKCFPSYTFNNNAMIASPSHFPPSAYPAGNLFGPNPTNVGFADYNDGNGGNYQLTAGSPYKNLGSDGKDLGADIVGLNSFLENVD
jgi:hypothetical protein